MVFICVAVYELTINTWVLPYFYSRWRPYTTQHMVQPVYYSPVSYTAKQMKTNHVLFSKYLSKYFIINMENHIQMTGF